MSILMCHYFNIYIGDLYRYREQLVAKPNWTKPRRYLHCLNTLFWMCHTFLYLLMYHYLLRMPSTDIGKTIACGSVNQTFYIPSGICFQVIRFQCMDIGHVMVQ